MKKLLLFLLILPACLGFACKDGYCDNCKGDNAYFELSGKEYCIECYNDIRYTCAICQRKGYNEYNNAFYCSDCYKIKRLESFNKEQTQNILHDICKKYPEIVFVDVDFDTTTFAIPTTLKINGFEKLSLENQFAFCDELKTVKDISLRLLSDGNEYRTSTAYNGHYKKITKNGEIFYEYPGDPAQTEYTNLTVYQKYLICLWIQNQYDAYDKAAGGYTGDKYTKEIFYSASEKYNKTYTQINTIWGELYDIKKALGLYKN